MCDLWLAAAWPVWRTGTDAVLHPSQLGQRCLLVANRTEATLAASEVALAPQRQLGAGDMQGAVSDSFMQGSLAFSCVGGGSGM